MWRDLTYAVRGLWRTPVFTAAVTLVLGLAIGANATIFGLIDGLWFRHAGVRDSGSLVRVFSVTPRDLQGAWSWAEYTDLRARLTSFDTLVARSRRGVMLRNDQGALELSLVSVVSTNFFSAMGVDAALGRLFPSADEGPFAQPPGVVLGHAFWVRRFGADPSVIGRPIRLGPAAAVDATILGVLPERFRDIDTARDFDLWIPIPTWRRLASTAEFERRDLRVSEVIGRLRPGVGAGRAANELETVVRGLDETFRDPIAGRHVRVLTDLRYRIEGSGKLAIVLLGLVALVVAITCVNVANLLLARGAARTQECAIRTALGASHWQLVQQQLIESVLLGALGAVAGLLIATWLLHVTPAILVEPPGSRSFAIFRIDSRVLGFTLGVTLLTTVLFSLAPSWIGARANLVPLFTTAPGGATPRAGGTVRTILVSVEIAASMVLLYSAGILTRSFLETWRADLGFERKPMLAATVSGVPAPLARAALERMAALPGVTAAALALRAPLSLSGGGRAQPVVVPGRAEKTAAADVKFNAVGANYFGTLGIRVMRGRVFDSGEDGPGPPVVVVNEQFVRQFVSPADPVGAVVRIGAGDGIDHRIVGVVRNTVINQIGESVEPYCYLPFWRGRYGEATILIASSRDAAALAAPVRDALRRTDPRLEPLSIVALTDLVRFSENIYRTTAVLATAVGLIGWLLTTIGVYGVVAYQTTRRTREIGIRLALGANSRQVGWDVLRDGSRMTVWGLLAGVPLAIAVSRWLGAELFGIGPWDPLTFAVSISVLIATVSGATMIPVCRAVQVAPSVALRET